MIELILQQIMQTQNQTKNCHSSHFITYVHFILIGCTPNKYVYQNHTRFNYSICNLNSKKNIWIISANFLIEVKSY